MSRFIAGIFCIFILGFFMGIDIPMHQPKTENNVKSGYVIRMEGKNINVYRVTKEGETFEKNVNEANVFDMPDKLAAEFKKGIFADGRYELEKLIEEITS